MLNEHKRKKKNKGVKRKEWAHNRWFKDKDGGKNEEEGGKAVAEEENGERPPSKADLGIGVGGSSGSQGVSLAQVLEGQLAKVMGEMSTPSIANPKLPGEGDDDADVFDGEDEDEGGSKGHVSVSEIEFLGWAKQVKAEYKVKKEEAAKEKALVAADSMFPEVCDIKFSVSSFVVIKCCLC